MVSAGPSSTIRPRYITPSRSDMCRTTARLWLMNRNVSPSRSCRSRIRFRICACTETSSALVGSSQTRNSGSLASARAIEMRWRCPPENSCGYRSPSDGDEPHLRQQRRHELGARRRVRRQAEGADRLGHDVAHAPARIERGVRVLEDHVHPPPQARLRAGHRERLALETDLAPARRVAGPPPAGRWSICRSRFAHQRQGGAARNGEGHGIDRAQPDAALARQHALQPGAGHVEHAGDADRLQHRRGFGDGGSGASGIGGSRRLGCGGLGAVASQQAASVGPAGISSGRSVRQRSKACGQRGWKAQPGGIAFSRGIAPSICASRATRCSSEGMLPISPFGVGMRRRAHHLARPGRSRRSVPHTSPRPGRRSRRSPPCRG